MGKKTAPLILCCAFLLNPIRVSAETVDDLYNFYDLDKTLEVDEEISTIIQNYNDIKKFVAMYNYIDLSVPDTATQDKLVEQLEDRIEEINEKLFRGYDLTLSEILDLEVEQQEALDKIDRINMTRNYVQLEIDFPDAETAPTYEEYLDAKESLSAFELSKELGDVKDVSLPVSGGTLKSHSSYDTIVTVPGSATVVAVFPGIVKAVDDNLIEIETVGNVVVCYKNLSLTGVAVGDTVKQYQRIATATEFLSLSLQIDGDYYDIGRLFE